MDEKTLKKLTRMELLELLVDREKEVENLKAVIAEQEARLADRSIKIENAGSIAEAALSLNGVLEAANAAAQQYVDNVRAMYSEQDDLISRKIEETESKCFAQEFATKERCAHLREETERECQELRESTQLECNTMKITVSEQCAALKDSTERECAEMSAKISDTFARLDEISAQRAAEDDARSAEVLQAAEAKAKALLAKADQDVENRWLTLASRLEAFYKAHSGLKELMSSTSDLSGLV